MAEEAYVDHERGARSERSHAPSVLLVEDDVLVRLDTAEQLRARGMAVIEAADAVEALAILESGVKVDVLFTDIRMPGTMDGLGLARAVGDRYPGLKVILCSGDHASLRELVTEKETAALADFFPKPYRVDEIEKRIRQLLDFPE